MGRRAVPKNDSSSSEEEESSLSSSSSESAASTSSATVATLDHSAEAPPSDDDASQEEEEESDASSSSTTASSNASSTTIPVDPSSQHEDDDDDAFSEHRPVTRTALRLPSRGDQEASASSSSSASETVLTEVTEPPRKSQPKPRPVSRSPTTKPVPPPQEDASSSSSSASPEEEDASSASSDTVASEKSDNDAASDSSSSVASEPADDDDDADSRSSSSSSATVQTSETKPPPARKEAVALAKDRTANVAPATRKVSPKDNHSDDDDDSSQAADETSDSDTVPSDVQDDDSSSDEKDQASASSASASASSEESSSSRTEEEEETVTSESETVLTDPVASVRPDVAPVRESSVRALPSPSASLQNVRIESNRALEKPRSQRVNQENTGAADRKSLRDLLLRNEEPSIEAKEEGALPRQLVQSSPGDEVSVLTDDTTVKRLEKMEIGGTTSDAVSCLHSIESSPHSQNDQDDDAEPVTSQASLGGGGGISMIFYDSKPSLHSEESAVPPNSNSLLHLDFNGNAVEVGPLADPSTEEGGTQNHPAKTPSLREEEEEPVRAMKDQGMISRKEHPHKTTPKVLPVKKPSLFGRFKMNRSARSKQHLHEPVHDVNGTDVRKPDSVVPDMEVFSALVESNVVPAVPPKSSLNSHSAHVSTSRMMGVERKTEHKKGFGRTKSFDSSENEGVHPPPKVSLFGFFKRQKFQKHSSFDDANPAVVNKPTNPNDEKPSADQPIGFRLVDDAVFHTASNSGPEPEDADAPMDKSAKTEAALDQCSRPIDLASVESMNSNVEDKTKLIEIIPAASAFALTKEAFTLEQESMDGTSPTDALVTNDDDPSESEDDEEGDVEVQNEADASLSDPDDDASNNEDDDEEEQNDSDTSLSDADDNASDVDEDDEELQNEGDGSLSDAFDECVSFSMSDSEHVDENEGDIDVSESCHSEDAEDEAEESDSEVAEDEESESKDTEDEEENSNDESNARDQSGSVEDLDDTGSDSVEEGFEVQSGDEKAEFVDFIDLSDMISVSSAVSKRLANEKETPVNEHKGRALDAFESDEEPVNDVTDAELFTGFNFYATSNVEPNHDEDEEFVDDDLSNSDPPESDDDSSEEEEVDMSEDDCSEAEEEPFEEQSTSLGNQNKNSHAESDAKAVTREPLFVEGAIDSQSDNLTDTKSSAFRSATEDAALAMNIEEEEESTSGKKPRRRSILAMFGLAAKPESPSSNAQTENVSNDTTLSLLPAENSEKSKSPLTHDEENAYEVEEVLGTAPIARDESFSLKDLNLEAAKYDEASSLNPADKSSISLNSFDEQPHHYDDSQMKAVSHKPENLVDSAVDLMGVYGADIYADEFSSSKVSNDGKRNDPKEHKGFNLPVFRLPKFARKSKKAELEDASTSDRNIEPVFFAQTSPESHGIIDVELGNQKPTSIDPLYDSNMEHSSSLVSDDFRIREVPRRMSIGSSMSPRRTSADTSPRKVSIGSHMKASISAGARKHSMSSSNSGLSNWLVKPKESSLPSISVSNKADKKKVVNHVDLDDAPVVKQHSRSEQAMHPTMEDDIELGMAKSSNSKKPKSSPFDDEDQKSKENKLCHPYCRMLAIAVLAILGLVLGVIIGTVVGGSEEKEEENSFNNDRSVAPVPPISPTVSPVTLLPTQSPILHQDIYITLCAVLPDCSVLLNTTAPPGQAFQWLTTDAGRSDDAPGLISRFALATLYFSTNGADWVDDTNWLSPMDVCDWYTSSINACDEQGSFVVLELLQNNVTGTLPMELGLLTDLTRLSIQNPILEGRTTTTASQLTGRLDHLLQNAPFPKLTSLSLVGHQFTGGIPTELNALTLLSTLDLSFNDLRGDIPYQLDALSNLEYVNLSHNQLTGGIPAEFLAATTQLIDLNLEGNVLTSVADTTALAALTSLSRLNLAHNALVLFPTAVTALSATLQSLDVSHNGFGGTLPSALGDMAALQELRLAGNRLTGVLPSALGNLVGLTRILDVSANQLRGTIPAAISQWVQLQELYLNDNALTGPIPAELIRWTSMQVVRVDGNALSGTIPSLVCQEWSLLQSYGDCRSFNASSTGDPSSCFTFCCGANTESGDESGSCICNYETTAPLRCLG